MTQCIDGEQRAPEGDRALDAADHDGRRPAPYPAQERHPGLPAAYEIQAGEADHSRRVAIGLAALVLELARSLASRG